MKTYYSTARGLAVVCKQESPTFGPNGRQDKMPTIAQFAPFGNTPYGILQTEDPDIIAWMEAAVKRGGDGIMSPDQFKAAVVPADQKINQLLAAMTEKDRELAKLQAQLAKAQQEGRQARA